MGTSFKIYLPRMSPPALPETCSFSEGSLTQAGTETIVVVEDEAAIRTLAERVLRAAGYGIHSYPSADDALEALMERELSADLLLTDVVLPGVLQGKDLADLVEGSRPDLAVLYMSGHTQRHCAPRET